MGTLIHETSPWVGGLKTGKGLVAKVWSGNDTLSRLPKDSPPVEKKRLRRLANTWLYQQRAPLASLDDALIADSPSEDAPATHTKARSKSPLCPIIKHTASMRTQRGQRRVTFRPQVTVEYMDNDMHIKTVLEHLVVAPRDRQQFMHRNLSRIAQIQKFQIQSNSQFCPAVHHCADCIPSSMSPPHLSATLESNKSSLLLNAKNELQSVQGQDSIKPQVNIYFIPDKNQGTKMKMVVNIGAQFHPEDICVKANMSGNKVRVMASKVVLHADGSHDIEPINERLMLPMEVDPYAVEARLDTKGHLTIEAPLLTHARRATINQGSAQVARLL